MPGKLEWCPPEAFSRPRPRKQLLFAVLCVLAATLTAFTWNHYFKSTGSIRNSFARAQRVPLNAQQILNRCAKLKAIPGPPSSFVEREVSDRFEPGTKATLIRNATIWTGGRNGTEIISGDLLLDGGIIKGVGKIPNARLPDDLIEINAMGAWLTPGLGQTHSPIFGST